MSENVEAISIYLKNTPRYEIINTKKHTIEECQKFWGCEIRGESIGLLNVFRPSGSKGSYTVRILADGVAVR